LSRGRYEHGAAQDWEVEMYSIVMDHQFTEPEREAFARTVIALSMYSIAA
jgi:hypothetical protein